MSFEEPKKIEDQISDDISEPLEFLCILDEASADVPSESDKTAKSSSCDSSESAKTTKTSSCVFSKSGEAVKDSVKHAKENIRNSDVKIISAKGSEDKKTEESNTSRKASSEKKSGKKTSKNNSPKKESQNKSGKNRSRKNPGKKARQRRRKRMKLIASILAACAGLGIAFLIFYLCTNHANTKRLREQMDDLRQIKDETVAENTETLENGAAGDEAYEITEPQVLPDYQALHNLNNDMVGWLSIEGTIIDYPVMQTKNDESFYLKRDFYRNPDKNGCLLVDDESTVGVATKRSKYSYLKDGLPFSERPSTNIIIHGHTMSSGDMFGDLDLYKDKEYGLSHKIICFDTLYEHREYELISVFYSKVYNQSDDVFKYYKFFEAYSPEEFYDWYYNILELSLYDTGTAAVFGDEFITLSCCAYHTKNGRFVVVGKRVL